MAGISDICEAGNISSNGVETVDDMGTPVVTRGPWFINN